MSERDRSITEEEQGRKSGWVVDKGNPNDWECLIKAHNDDLEIMKSTKRMEVPGGWIYCITTEKGDNVAETAVFVPRPEKRVDIGPR